MRTEFAGYKIVSTNNPNIDNKYYYVVTDGGLILSKELKVFDILTSKITKEDHIYFSSIEEAICIIRKKKLEKIS
jgi:hypothetical protein